MESGMMGYVSPKEINRVPREVREKLVEGRKMIQQYLADLQHTIDEAYAGRYEDWKLYVDNDGVAIYGNDDTKGYTQVVAKEGKQDVANLTSTLCNVYLLTQRINRRKPLWRNDLRLGARRPTT